jgi:hypothetical protein
VLHASAPDLLIHDFPDRCSRFGFPAGTGSAALRRHGLDGEGARHAAIAVPQCGLGPPPSFWLRSSDCAAAYTLPLPPRAGSGTGSAALTPSASQGIKLASDCLASNIMIENSTKYVLLLIYPIGHHHANVIAHRKQCRDKLLEKPCLYIARVMAIWPSRTVGRRGGLKSSRCRSIERRQLVLGSVCTDITESPAGNP